MNRLSLALLLAAVSAAPASAGVSYETSERVKSDHYNNTMKLKFWISGLRGRQEMSAGDFSDKNGSVTQQVEQANGQDQMQQAMGARGGAMDSYMKMAMAAAKTDADRQRVQQQFAMMSQMQGQGAAMGARANAAAMKPLSGAVAATRIVFVTDLKKGKAYQFTQGAQDDKVTEEALSEPKLVGQKWDADDVTVSASAPKKQKIAGKNCMLYRLKIHGSGTEAGSRESTGFEVTISYWMDPAMAKEGKEWLNYETARRRVSATGNSLLDGLDSFVYMTALPPAKRAEFDEAFSKLQGFPVRIKYIAKGKGLLFRLSDAMKQQAADSGSDLASATDDAAQGEEEAKAEGPGHAEFEKTYELTADFRKAKGEAVSAKLLTPPRS